MNRCGGLPVRTVLKHFLHWHPDRPRPMVGCQSISAATNVSPACVDTLTTILLCGEIVGVIPVLYMMILLEKHTNRKGDTSLTVGPAGSEGSSMVALRVKPIPGSLSSYHIPLWEWLQASCSHPRALGQSLQVGAVGGDGMNDDYERQTKCTRPNTERPSRRQPSSPVVSAPASRESHHFKLQNVSIVQVSSMWESEHILLLYTLLTSY